MPYHINDSIGWATGDQEPEDSEELCPSCGAIRSLQERYAILYDGNKVSEQSWLECESCGAETDCGEMERLEKTELAKRKEKK